MGLDLLDGGKIRFFTTGALTASKIDMLSKVGLFIEQDPVDRNSIQFRIPSESTGTSHDRIALYISSSGFVGIGTKDPTSAFDIRDNSEDAAPSGSGKTQLFGLGTTGPVFAESITASKGISASGDIVGASLNILSSTSGLGYKISEPSTDNLLFAAADGGGFTNFSFKSQVTAQDTFFSAEGMTHEGDTDTKITFGTDQITLTAGNVDMITLDENGNDILTFGNVQTKFEGHITSSGNISASFGKTIFASSASLDVLTGTSGEDGLDVTGFVSASTAVASPTGSFNVFTKFPHIIYAGSNHYNGLGRYIAWNDPSEQNTPSSLGPEYTEFIFPRSGSLRDFHMKFETATTSTTEVRFYIVPNGTDYATAGASNAQEVVELPAVAAHTHQGHAVSASFAPGDRLTVYVDPGHSSATAVNFTLVMEYDMTSYNLYS